MIYYWYQVRYMYTQDYMKTNVDENLENLGPQYIV